VEALPAGRCVNQAPPPPPLPYKVDTSRPSLRTNWTRQPGVLGRDPPTRAPPRPAPPRPRRCPRAPRAACHPPAPPAPPRPPRPLCAELCSRPLCAELCSRAPQVKQGAQRGWVLRGGLRRAQLPRVAPQDVRARPRLRILRRALPLTARGRARPCARRENGSKRGVRAPRSPAAWAGAARDTTRALLARGHTTPCKRRRVRRARSAAGLQS